MAKLWLRSLRRLVVDDPFLFKTTEELNVWSLGTELHGCGTFSLSIQDLDYSICQDALRCPAQVSKKNGVVAFQNECGMSVGDFLGV